MHIEYDPQLIEQAVFLAARRDPELERELHAVVDPSYDQPAGEARDARFRDVYAAFSARLRLHRPLSELLAERPLIAGNVGRCIVREAARANAESAELFVRRTDGTATPRDRTLLIQVCPKFLLDTERLAHRMRRELLHVADMLDEQFAYRLAVISGLPARRDLVRDRYRVLWDTYVQGRLAREDRADDGYTQSLRRMFAAAFNGCGGPSQDSAFQRVFSAATLTHDQLLGWAETPATLLGAQPASSAPRGHHRGNICPLCGFPTHDWFEFAGATGPATAEAIRRCRPQWRLEDGSCRQCAETYAAAGDRR